MVKKNEMNTDRFEVHAFSDVHLHLVSFVGCVSVFSFHFDSMLTLYWITYCDILRVYMYKRAGTSDILTFVYITGLLVFGLTFAGTV